MKDTCDKCIHCTHETEGYYFCEVEGDYISAQYALDEDIGCDIFVENVDDNKTEKP